MINDVKLTRVSDFDGLNQRIAKPEVWLDEVLQAIELAIEDAINNDSTEGKNNILLALSNYLGGIADGNRFMRPNPYTDSKPLTSAQLRRVIYK
jgi:hypothetical protein